jgi:hypothetical protein
LSSLRAAPPTDSRSSSLSCYEEPGLPARGPHHTLEIQAGGATQLWALRRDGRGGWDAHLVYETR